MSSAIRKKIKTRLYCHRCNKEYKGKNYLIYKDGYGWVCPRCGYEKPVKEWIEGAVI